MSCSGALPSFALAWQISVPPALEISHVYFPTASSLSLLRTSRIQVSLVVLMLYLYDAQISLPSFFQVTFILWLPVYMHLRVKGSQSLK